MKHEFKRKAFIPGLALITAAIMAFTTLLQFAMGSPAAFLNLIACVLFAVQAIWGFSTPYIIIDEGAIFIKETIARNRVIYLAEIERIDLSNKSYIKIYHNGTSEKIRYFTVSSSHKDELREMLTLMAPNGLTA